VTVSPSKTFTLFTNSSEQQYADAHLSADQVPPCSALLPDALPTVRAAVPKGFLAAAGGSAHVLALRRWRASSNRLPRTAPAGHGLKTCTENNQLNQAQHDSRVLTPSHPRAGAGQAGDDADQDVRRAHAAFAAQAPAAGQPVLPGRILLLVRRAAVEAGAPPVRAAAELPCPADK